MGICLSKRDIMIQRPRRPDSPSGSSVSTITEKCLMKNGSIGSSFMRSSSASNVAECGSSARWRSTKSSMHQEDILEPRMSGFSHLSSPTMEGIDLDSIVNTAVRSSRLLEIDEELEDCTTEDDERSLSVFGDNKRTPAPPNRMLFTARKQVKNGANKDLEVFGAERYFGTMRSASNNKKQELPVFSRFDPELLSELDSVKSARWGFSVDSSGTDEMEEIVPSNNHKFMAVPGPIVGGWGLQFANRSMGSYSDSDSNSKLNLNSKYATGSPASSFSSSMVFTEDDGTRFPSKMKTSLHCGVRHRRTGTTDEDFGSDTSDDLFEIGNIGADYEPPLKNSDLFKDPDISGFTKNDRILGVKNGISGVSSEILRADYGSLPLRQQRFQKSLPPRQQRKRSFTANTMNGHLKNGTKFSGR